jgi:hypothetical protein
MKRLVLFLLFTAFVLALPSAFKRFTCGFKLAKMHIDLPFRPDWEVAPSLSREDLNAILDQPFSYLDKGAQCYVFQSGDERHVVKLFRYDQPHIIRHKKTSVEWKREKLFSACLLAYQKAREETGLVYLHLNVTRGEVPILHAKGPIGQTLHFHLDRYRFAIQKKAQPFRASLLEAYHSSDKDALPRLIDSFVSVLSSRLGKGIGNSDPTVSRNFGFLEGKAVEIDFGNYYVHPPTIDEMHRYTHRLRRWLKHHAPEWVSYLDEKVKQCENTSFSS